MRSGEDQAAVTWALDGRLSPGRVGDTVTGRTKFTDAGATGVPTRSAGYDRWSVSSCSVMRLSVGEPGSRSETLSATCPLTVPLVLLTPTSPRRAVALTPVAVRSTAVDSVGLSGAPGTMNTE